MEYLYATPLNGVTPWEKPVFDSHVHIWKPEKKDGYNPNFSWKLFIEWVNLYYGKDASDFYCLGMMEPALKKAYTEEYAQNIVFAYYMGTKAFGTFDIKRLLEQVDEAQQYEYPMLKIWLAPRMIDFIKEMKPGFRINDSRFNKVYEKIEDYGFKVIIHVSDPDNWYWYKYQEKEKYGTKEGRLEDFCDIMSRYPKIDWISAHLGCLPENLPKLEKMFEDFPRLYVDTGSTRWMIRELGKHPKQTKEWFKKYIGKGKILFGSDISVAERFNPEYITTRFWSHKVFWETNSVSPELPFTDSDSPFGVKIHGLDLDESTLEKFYYKNAFKLFNIK